jgi:GxxExxY protein
VSNALGVGFLEKVYENALAHELRKAGLFVDQQHSITVHHDSVVVGSYSADLLVEKTVLVELKAVTALDSVHRAQCINGDRAGATAARQAATSVRDGYVGGDAARQGRNGDTCRRSFRRAW